MIFRRIARSLTPRGIFAKLVTVFLVIGLVPFLGMELFTYTEAKDRMTATVIEYWLVRLARETAAQLDQEVQRMYDLTQAWAQDGLLSEGVRALRRDDGGNRAVADRELRRYLYNHHKTRQGEIDYLALVDRDGTILADSLFDEGQPHPTSPLTGRSVSSGPLGTHEQEWLELALENDAGGTGNGGARGPGPPLAPRDWHASGLLAWARGNPPREGYPPDPSRYALGFAGTLNYDDDPAARAAVVVVFNWQRVHGILDRTWERFKTRDDPVKPGSRYASGYPFLFANDCDTIIGHADPDLIGNSLVRNHGLGKFRRLMLSKPYGSIQYEYPPGTPKISGFARASGPERRGFGWVVGVGINDADIFADVWQIGEVLLIAALIVTGLVILGAAVFSHRITEPITGLIRYTEEVARGNLDAHTDVKTRDEIAVLAASFNKMVDDLKESNRRLIQAEKNAAWQEMARQVAHEIKNPLTPIKLAAQQIRRAHSDRHASFDEILEESVSSIIEQCESLQKIATDFAKFAAFSSQSRRPEDLRDLVEWVVGFYGPQLETAGIETETDLRVPPGTAVRVNRDDVRRVFINLFNNAIEAMAPCGGKLTVTASIYRGQLGRMVRVAIRDTGRGIPPEDRRRLFEPYFSTRTGGTGLGLALSKKILAEHGGHIEVESEVGRGTTMIIHLPAHDGPEEDGPDRDG